MKPAPFEYIAPQSLDEALDALQRHGYEGKLLAGGQSLLPVMNYRLAQPAVIIDLNPISELAAINAGRDSNIRVGAMVRQSQLEFSQVIAEKAPLVSEAVPYIAHSQIRNRGTIGGSLAHADPAAELPVIMVALGARFHLQRRGSQRWVAAEDFYKSLFVTALGTDEMLVEIEIPPILANSGFAFAEFARRRGDYAQVGVAATLNVDGNGFCHHARLVFLNVGEIPMVAAKAVKLLVGEKLTPDLLADAAEVASQQEIDPVGDIHASSAYKRHLASVLGRRTLQKAFQRAISRTQL